MPYVLGFSALAVMIALWWIVFRQAMKTPNNGNEFSRDDIETGGGGGS
jgi:hypothetical protein